MGNYDAGAVSETKAHEYAELGLRVVAISDPVPSSPIVTSRTADSRMVDAVRRALREVDVNGKHRALVKSWDPELAYGVMDANDADDAGLRELVKRFGLLDPQEAAR